MATPKRPPGPDLTKVFDEVRKSLGGFGKLGSLPFVAGFLGISAYGLYTSIYFVQGGCRAVKFNAITGLNNTTYGEGANLAIPFIETPIVFDIRQKPTEIVTASGSRDLQMITMSIRVLYRPDTNNLHHIYRELGVNYADTVLPSIMNEVVKAVIAQFNASELLIKRPEVSSRIATLLAHRAKHFHLLISDVSITQLEFGKEYTAAIEAKQIAQQMAERAKFTVEQALEEKKSAIVLAEGEAESARLIGTALKNNPVFLELRRLEASKLIARTVGNGSGTTILDSNGLMLNPLQELSLVGTIGSAKKL